MDQDQDHEMDQESGDEIEFIDAEHDLSEQGEEEEMKDVEEEPFEGNPEEQEMAIHPHQQQNFFKPIYPHHLEDELPLADFQDDVSSDEVMKMELNDFIQNFDAQYGPNTPPFYIGSFDEAKLMAAQTGKFFLIYLHSHSEEVQLFCREVLCSEAIVQILAENFIVWGWDVSSPHRFNILRAIISRHVTSNINFFLPKQFPFIAILATINGSLTLLDSSSGFVPTDELTMKLLIAIENHHIVLEEERLKYEQREEQRNSRDLLLKEQEEEYLRSLEEDRVKEEQRKKEEEERIKLEEEKKHQQLEEEKRKLDLKQSLPTEPAADCKEPISNILFRLPDGRKLQRKFLASTKIKILFDYLETEGFSVRKGCTVQTNFPKRQISIDLEDVTLKEGNLFPQETLFVQNP